MKTSLVYRYKRNLRQLFIYSLMQITYTVSDIIANCEEGFLMNGENFGKRLKIARIKKGYTQEKLAEKTDTSTSYISDIERGVKTPSLSTFIELISALDISADYILQGTLDSGKKYLYDEVSVKLDKLTPQQRQFIIDFIDLYSKSLGNQ